MEIKRIIKKIIPAKVLEVIIDCRAEQKFREIKKQVTNYRQQKKIIFLLATPNHGNIGDQAIAHAELQFLHEELKQFHVVEIMYNEYLKWNSKLEMIIEPEDIICYHGGGNMGTEYFECELVFRDIITRFIENKIISFPQTIYYDNTAESQIEFEKSKEIYNSHSNLTLVAREQYSYEIMKKAYGASNNVLMVPDIVLYLKPQTQKKRNGALVCFRNDVERSLHEDDHKYIYDIISKYYATITKSDTIIDRDYISKEERMGVVEEKLREFREAELVLTDRLHGMVFAYLSNTPCLVLSNYNYKVKGVYEWIKNRRNIFFLDDVRNLENCLRQIKEIEEPYVINDSAFEKLKNTFLGCEKLD